MIPMIDRWFLSEAPRDLATLSAYIGNITTYTLYSAPLSPIHEHTRNLHHIHRMFATNIDDTNDLLVIARFFTAYTVDTVDCRWLSLNRGGNACQGLETVDTLESGVANASNAPQGLTSLTGGNSTRGRLPKMFVQRQDSNDWVVGCVLIALRLKQLLWWSIVQESEWNCDQLSQEGESFDGKHLYTFRYHNCYTARKPREQTLLALPFCIHFATIGEFGDHWHTSMYSDVEMMSPNIIIKSFG